MTRTRTAFMALALALPALGACGAFLGLSGDDDDGPVPAGDPDAAGDGSNVADASGTNDAPTNDAPDASDAATVDAGPTERYVFVSSSIFTGDLGGLLGADQKCNQLANFGDAKLKGRAFVAFVSIGGVVTSAASRIGVSNVPYKLLDGTIVANDSTSFLDGPHLSAINRNENNAFAGISGGVWTGTNLGGTASGFDCAGWASLVDGESGTFGVPSLLADGGWVNAGTVQCTDSRRLYCVER